MLSGPFHSIQQNSLRIVADLFNNLIEVYLIM